ncbi:MAG: oligosaccharide flippase family protein [Clostridia bacterium]|nr:oligosaccharide flippase family protein [Clostridia bacterium]MBR6523965.1 oligosaccharide flippase family protein [Clostridia bacterium]
MKFNQLKAGAILSYATQGVHILTGLLYTPVMLRLLGQSEYGLYQLVYSVVSYLSLLSLGFGASYVRFFSRYKVKDENEEIEKLNGMFMTIFSVIAVICILCGGIMIKNATSIFGSGLTETELYKARILLAIMIFNMAVTFINSVFSSIMTAHEKFFFQRLVKLLREIFNPFLTLPLLFMGYGSIAMVAITTILTVAGLVADGFFCIKKLKVRFRFSSFELSVFKEMWGFTFFIFLGMIVDQLNWSVDKFLLGRMIGTSAVAVYGVAAQLNTLYITLSAAVSAVFIPRVNFIVAKNDDNNLLTDLFIKVGRIQFLVLGLVVTGFIIFGREFIALWAGKGYGEAYLIGLFLMIPATVPLVQNLGIEIQRAKNMHKARALVYLLVAIGNIFVSIPCIKKWGTSGAAIGTAISLTVGNILFMNWYYYKRMNLDMFLFWKKLMRLLSLSAICVGLGEITKTFLLIPESLGSLIAVILLYCVIYAVLIWLFGMNISEKNLVLKPLEKLRNKLCKK